MSEMWDSMIDPTAEDVSLAPPLEMDEATRLGLGILVAAVGLGLLGDALLRAAPWGLNVGLWVGTLVLAVVALLEWRAVRATGGGRGLVWAALFFAGALAWRASPTLAALDVLALLVVLGLAGSSTLSGQLRQAGIVEYAWRLVLAALYALLGPLALLVQEIRWQTIPRHGWTRQAVAVGRGLLLALPLLVVFGGLFVAADAAFAHLVTDVLDVDVAEWLGHGIMIIFWTWLAAGWLHQMLLVGPSAGLPAARRPALARLGLVETGIVLGAMNGLFLAFVLVQFRYFFGGAALVEASTGLTYAEYARSGFFELVTVAALVLPLLLGTHWLLSPTGRREQRLFGALAGALIALLFVIMLSAVQRMRLYQAEFGLTELRLYTTAFMGWLAVVFGWFALTVLRGQRDRFVFGALATALVTLALLHALNPDAFIVRTNVARETAPHPFDSRYATSLSADAVPPLVAALPAMPQADRCRVAARLLRDWAPPDRVDWRTWNWGRWQAWRTVDQNLGALQTMACPDDRS